MIRNPAPLFDTWRDGFGPLNQGRVDGINTLLAEMEAREWADQRWWAYVLATAWHETGGTMRPLEEYGRGAGHAYGRTDPVTGEAYFGRGYVQLTWKDNYARLGGILGLPLVGEPELALEPVNAARIMCEGMARGLFTGKGLPDYFDADTDDPRNARRIVNGTDRAAVIASYHAKALAAVKAGWGETVDPVAAWWASAPPGAHEWLSRAPR